MTPLPKDLKRPISDEIAELEKELRGLSLDADIPPELYPTRQQRRKAERDQRKKRKAAQ